MARLPQVKLLNSSEVRPREREDAEKAYFQRCRQEFLSSIDATLSGSDAELFGACCALCLPDRCRPVPRACFHQAVDAGADFSTALGAQFIAAHPRYPELLARFGASVGRAGIDASGASSMAASVVKVTLRSMAGGMCRVRPFLQPTDLA